MPAGPIVPLAETTINPLVLHPMVRLVMACALNMPIRTDLEMPLLTTGIRPQVVVRKTHRGPNLSKTLLTCAVPETLVTTALVLTLC